MYKIQLHNFEGPIDLLLYFIRRDELDIYDIPIAKITKQFIPVWFLIKGSNEKSKWRYKNEGDILTGIASYLKIIKYLKESIKK